MEGSSEQAGACRRLIEVDARLSLRAFTLSAQVSDEGRICLSGPNGSGKSTLLSIIAGVRQPDSGHVKLDGVDITALPMERRGVVLVTPDSYIPHLTVDRHLEWGAHAMKANLEAGELGEVKRALGIDYGGRVDTLSLGMRERVSLATALLSGTKTILVDEAFSNIDGKESFIRAFFGLASGRNLDVVFTTQNEAEGKLAEHHYGLTAGVSKKLF
jgi:molybdate/tungstate transport system ATP-binding protein